MSRVSEVKWGIGKRELGDFKVKRFNLFKDEDADGYAHLRTLARDSSNGITIETIREYSRKTVIRSRDNDGDETVTTIEDVYLVVHYWEREPKRLAGESDDEYEEKRKLASVPGRS